MATKRENKRSKLVSIRLTFKMIAELKKLADRFGRPYQSVMKDAIERGLPIVKEVGATEVRIKKEVRIYRALNVEAAIEKLRQVRTK